MTQAGKINATLTDGLTGDVEDILVGLNWTLLKGPEGTGLAHTPARGTSGCYGLSGAGTKTGKPLADTARGLASENPFDRAAALSAINAHFNRTSLQGENVNGLDFMAARTGKTVVIGRFPGLDEKIPDALVIERNPGPDDHAVSEAPDLLADADQVLITASTVADGSLATYLDMAPNAFAMVIGPGTPLCTGLFDCGIDALAGFVVEDTAEAFRAIAEGGAVRALRPSGRNVCLIKS